MMNRITGGKGFPDRATQGTINRLVAADPIKIIAHKKDVFQKV